MSKLVFGCGYLGERVARLWLAEGHSVSAVSRSAERCQQLKAQGIQSIQGDIASLTEEDIPADVKTVLFAVGYDRSSGQSIHEVYVDGLARVLSVLPPTVERFIYISSTGVFGGGGGERVDEDSECVPRRDGGKACLAAEQLLLQSRFVDRTIRLRLAGIYGPGRIPRSADLLAGKPIDAPATGYLNLIHVDDAAKIVLLAEQKSAVPRLYVVSDGHPVLRSTYYAELAQLLGAPTPTFVAPDPQTAAAQRAAGDKRVSSDRLMHELAPVLEYPSYREGLRAIVGSR